MQTISDCNWLLFIAHVFLPLPTPTNGNGHVAFQVIFLLDAGPLKSVFAVVPNYPLNMIKLYIVSLLHECPLLTPQTGTPTPTPKTKRPAVRPPEQLRS